MNRFKEIQYFNIIWYLILLLPIPALITAPTRPPLLWASLGICMVLLVCLKLETVVTDEYLRVALGFLPVIRRTVRFENIESVESVTYNAILQYGGRGIRFGKNNTMAFSTKGKTGVMITLKDERRLLIGSQQTDVLFEAIEAARQNKS